jgi:hypothetical protein
MDNPTKRRYAMNSGISLSTLIDELRRELTEAIQRGVTEDLRFELGSIDLELDVVVEKCAGPNVKVKFLVVELGADRKITSSASQRIKITLTPKHRLHPTQNPLIAGSKAGNER